MSVVSQFNNKLNKEKKRKIFRRLSNSGPQSESPGEPRQASGFGLAAGFGVIPLIPLRSCLAPGAAEFSTPSRTMPGVYSGTTVNYFLGLLVSVETEGLSYRCQQGQALTHGPGPVLRATAERRSKERGQGTQRRDD